MVTDLVIGVFTTVLSFLIGLLPSWTAPGYLTDVTDWLSDTMGSASGVGYWIPLGPMVAAMGLLFAAWLIAIGIRFGRILASFFSGGGGSAA